MFTGSFRGNTFGFGAESLDLSTGNEILPRMFREGQGSFYLIGLIKCTGKWTTTISSGAFWPLLSGPVQVPTWLFAIHTWLEPLKTTEPNRLSFYSLATTLIVASLMLQPKYIRHYGILEIVWKVMLYRTRYTGEVNENVLPVKLLYFVI